MAVPNKRWRIEMWTFLCFTLVWAFYPIGYVYAIRQFVQRVPFNWTAVVADGGILTVAIGLSFGSMARLQKSNHKWVELEIVLMAFDAIAMLGGSFFLAFRYVDGAINSTAFVDLCLLVFIVSLLIAIFCQLLPEDDE